MQPGGLRTEPLRHHEQISGLDAGHPDPRRWVFFEILSQRLNANSGAISTI